MDMRFYRYVRTCYPKAEIFWKCVAQTVSPFIFRKNGEFVAAAMPMLLTAAVEPYQPYIDEIEKIVAVTLDKDPVE